VGCQVPGTLRQLEKRGYVFPERHLKQMSSALRLLGFADAADDVLAMGTKPK
jgi:hypothetical protein